MQKNEAATLLVTSLINKQGYNTEMTCMNVHVQVSTDPDKKTNRLVFTPANEKYFRKALRVMEGITFASTVLAVGFAFAGYVYAMAVMLTVGLVHLVWLQVIAHGVYLDLETTK